MERITAVEWRPRGDETHPASCAALMREHLRRVALWADLLETPEWPYPSLARIFDNTVQVPEDSREELLRYLEENVIFAHVSMLCRHMVEWACVLDRTKLPLPGLPDPYEPLLILFERGGEFRVENNRWAEFPPWFVPLKERDRSASEKPLSALDGRTLDAIDEENRFPYRRHE
ncbi:hypothetical protein ACSNOK_05465 [Streptomyces sp. URMC 126]|uniref:hypothetical protein n=1 Tax=Streptomyces sp. URMC 126 TaxID=3423401 RepID=UPI003F1DDC1E